MTQPDKLSIEDDAELVIRPVPLITTPAAFDTKWIKNAKGEIIGYENTRIMTREEFKEIYE